MSGSTSTSPTSDLIAAAKAGARSLHVVGWIADECESAAVEALVRRPCLNVGLAYLRGRAAAIDELRALTHHRRAQPGRPVPLVRDVAAADESFARVDDRDRLDRWVAAQPIAWRRQLALIVEMTLAGRTHREVAAVLGLHESRISQILRRARGHSAA